MLLLYILSKSKVEFALLVPCSIFSAAVGHKMRVIRAFLSKMKEIKRSSSSHIIFRSRTCIKFMRMISAVHRMVVECPGSALPAAPEA